MSLVKTSPIETKLEFGSPFLKQAFFSERSDFRGGKIEIWFQRLKLHR